MPWRNSAAKAGSPSDPYLMTGYDRKRLTLRHDADTAVRFTVEVDFIRNGTWKTYRAFDVSAGKTVTHTFPAGFSAHWVRLKVNKDCRATATFTYE